MITYPHAQPFTLVGQQLWLHPLRAVYWAEAAILLLSDLHLGKTTHFRRAGIATPSAVEDTNFDHLISLLLIFEPTRVLLLGDLFHSDYNAAWEELEALMAQFEHISFELVPGNHDILPAEIYTNSRLTMRPAVYDQPPFRFTHEPVTEFSEDHYNLAGHLHPGVILQGSGKQYLRLPCFYFGLRNGILPAFGAFTGLAMLRVTKTDRIFGIADGQVLPLK